MDSAVTQLLAYKTEFTVANIVKEERDLTSTHHKWPDDQVAVQQYTQSPEYTLYLSTCLSKLHSH